MSCKNYIICDDNHLKAEAIVPTGFVSIRPASTESLISEQCV
jgi:hypothetical protein